jgi:predicted RNA-binding Zn ribbon-like protein
LYRFGGAHALDLTYFLDRRDAELEHAVVEMREQIARQIDGRFAGDPHAKEDGQQFGRGKRFCAMRQQALPWALVAAPVLDRHRVTISSQVRSG